MQQEHVRPLVFNGQIKGTPHTRTETGALADHVIGTDSRVGTLSAKDDVVTIMNAACVDADGVPRLLMGDGTYRLWHRYGHLCGHRSREQHSL